MENGVVISQTLDRMIENGVGYRNESYSGSGVRNAEEVIRYELSMGNTDIVKFMQMNYQQLQEIVCGDDFFEENEGLELEELGRLRDAAFSELCQVNAPFITETVLRIAGDYLGCTPSNVRGLWLTSYECAAKRYGQGDYEDIDEYPLVRGKYLVVSDLGEDGALFLY